MSQLPDNAQKSFVETYINAGSLDIDLDLIC